MEPITRENRPGNVSVLVVDDQPEIRNITVLMLSRAGYTVSSAESGHEAVSLIRRRPVDIMVLDMVLGESFDGLDCYREALSVRPGLKAIIVSGYPQSSRVTEAQALGAGKFIQKPYHAKELLNALREELAKEHAASDASRRAQNGSRGSA
jgi:two-component system cell cycle sensor histidine kinase/response regulator CckA